MYPITHATSNNGSALGGHPAVDSGGASAVDVETLRLLALIEEAPAEVQAELCSRLLSGIAAKITVAQATKAVSTARSDIVSEPMPGQRPRNRAGKRSIEVPPRLNSQLSYLSDPADPILAWHHFGANGTTLFEVLRLEPLGVLEAMLRHDHMPPGPKPRGKTRQAIAETIAQRLEEHFSSLS